MMDSKEKDKNLVKVCRICLDCDSQLYSLSEYNLEGAYETVTGLSLQNGVKLAPTLCTECAYRLAKCYSFRKKSLRAHTLLLELLKDDEITIHEVKTVNREHYQLTSNLVKRVYEPNYHDLHIIDSEDDKKLELEKPICKVELKYEQPDDIAPVVKSVDETFNYVNVKQNLKYDNVEYFNADIEFDDDIDNDVDYSNVTKQKDELHSRVDNVYNMEFVNNYDCNVEILDDKFRSKNRINVSSKNNMTTTDLKQVDTVKHRKNILNSVRKKPEASNKKPRINLKLFKVTTLTYEQQLAEVQQRQESENYKRSKFKCTLCFIGFINENAHSRHMITHTDVCGEFTCALCSKHYQSLDILTKHLRHAHFVTYTCTSCGYVTKKKPVARSHEHQHFGTRYKCSHCDESFNAHTSYLSHLRQKHTSGDFICTLCGYSFVSKTGIAGHTRVKHRFDNVQNLEGPECIPCNVRFASDAAYSRHMTVSPKHNAGIRTGNKRRYNPKELEYVKCSECGLKVKGVRMYTLHLKRSHPEVYALNGRRFLCEQCGKSYKYQCVLDQHIEQVHLGLKKPKVIGAERRARYQCDVCAKTFDIKSQLALHVDIHRQNRHKYECPICLKVFSAKSSRNHHIKQLHTERKLYDCPICNKKFSSKANRERHKLIHKEKTIQCEICDKYFTTFDAKRTHTLHVHLNKPWPKRNRGPRAKPRPLKLEDTNTTREGNQLWH